MGEVIRRMRDPLHLWGLQRRRIRTSAGSAWTRSSPPSSGRHFLLRAAADSRGSAHLEPGI